MRRVMTRYAKLLGLALLLVALPLGATNPLVEFPKRPQQLPALQYWKLSNAACLSALRAKKIAFRRGPNVPTIAAPIRFGGTVQGVHFVMVHPTAKALKKGPVMDCRLALALFDLATVARKHDIREVRYNSIHRGRRVRKAGQRHAAGVAIDIVEFVRKDGGTFNVLNDFKGHGIGSKTCGPGAPQPKGKVASDFRALVCAIHATRSFNLVLTPHYDRRHDNHLHLEVRKGIKWFLTQ